MEQKQKALKDLNLLDRFLLSQAADDPDTMRDMLEIILGREVEMCIRDRTEDVSASAFTAAISGSKPIYSAVPNEVCKMTGTFNSSAPFIMEGSISKQCTLNAPTAPFPSFSLNKSIKFLYMKFLSPS